MSFMLSFQGWLLFDWSILCYVYNWLVSIWFFLYLRLRIFFTISHKFIRYIDLFKTVLRVLLHSAISSPLHTHFSTWCKQTEIIIDMCWSDSFEKCFLIDNIITVYLYIKNKINLWHTTRKNFGWRKENWVTLNLQTFLFSVWCWKWLRP